MKYNVASVRLSRMSADGQIDERALPSTLPPCFAKLRIYVIIGHRLVMQPSIMQPPIMQTPSPYCSQLVLNHSLMTKPHGQICGDFVLIVLTHGCCNLLVKYVTTYEVCSRLVTMVQHPTECE